MSKTSLAARISGRFRSASKSLASSIGLTEFGPHTPLYSNLFSALDSDHDGYLYPADVSAWLLDEQFINNPYWDLTNQNVSSTDELVARYWQRWDTTGSGRVSYAEWEQWFRAKKEKEVEEMGRSVIHLTRDRADKAVRKIFDAIDVNGQGDLDFDSVNAWLKYDAAYSAQQGALSPHGSEEQRQALFDQIDLDHDGCVTFDELAHYLHNWSVRDMRVRTSAMRQDAETRKMKRMAELLAATMASRLGLGNGNGESNDRLGVRAASVSGRPRSVSDMASGPPSSLNGSGGKVVEVSGATGAAAGAGAGAGAGGKRVKVKGTKSNIQRQIDDLVLQSLALAAESSEINAKRRKLNVVNEKLDRELLRCERERLKLLSAIAEQEADMLTLQEQAGASSPVGQVGINARLTAVNAELGAKRSSISALSSERNALAQSTVELHAKQTEVAAKLATANDALAPADAFIARTKETTANVERALDNVQSTPAGSDVDSAVQVDSDKVAVERKVAELRAQMEQVEVQRAGLLRDQQALQADLQHTKEEEEARRQQVAAMDAQVATYTSQLSQLETERAALEARAASGASVVPSGGADVGRRLADVSADLARKQDILATMNTDRETMSVQLREMEVQHTALTRRHIEISTQLTNINQQISILFDGQLHERRNSFGDAGSDGAADSLPVPCVASVECEMDAKKTTGLLNVSNYILMYESRIAHYQGRGLGAGGGEGKSPPSASSPVLSSNSRRTSLSIGVQSLSESTRFCVDISDVLSVRFIHTNDDDGHEEEGYEDEGLSELESSLKEPSIATIIIQLRPGYHNRFLSSDSSALEDDASHVVTPPNSGGPSQSPGPRLSTLLASASPSSQRGTTAVCYGDYDSLRRVDKSLRLFMQLLEAKVNHQAFRRRAASVQISTGREQGASLEEKVNNYRGKRGPGAAVERDPADITITGFSEITSHLNLKKILSSTPAIATSPTASPTACESWRLAYSQSQHGSSFPYFFRVIADSPQSMVVLKSAGGRLFGGYCGVEWEDRIHQTAGASFYGNRDCFVWRLVPDRQQPNGSTLSPPTFAHASSEPTGLTEAQSSLLLPSTAASSIVMDTMSKATHAVEVASAAGLDVAPAVRRASIDTTAMSLAGAPLSGMAAAGASAQTDAAQEALSEVPHVPSTLEVYPASGVNTNFMFSSPDLIGMGGRSSTLSSASSSAASTPTGFAWSIDRDFLEGSSSECDTYRSPVLAEAVEWQCANVEVWVPAAQIGYRSHAAAGQRSDDEEEAGSGNGGLLTPPTINISVTPPTVASPPQMVSPR